MTLLLMRSEKEKCIRVCAGVCVCEPFYPNSIHNCSTFFFHQEDRLP